MAFICLLFFILSFAISSAAPTFQSVTTEADVPENTRNLVRKTIETMNPNTALSLFLLKKPSEDSVWHFKTEAVDRPVRKVVVGWEKTAIDRQIRSAMLDPAADAIERQAKKTAIDQNVWKAAGAALLSSPNSHTIRTKTRQTDNSIISALALHSATLKSKSLSRSLDLLVSARQGGLTGDVCSSSEDCAGSRVCVDNIANASRCVPPSGLQACSSDSDCVTGERCVTNDGNSGCLSEALGGTSTPPPTSTTGPTTTEGGDGLLTGDVCSSSADCAGSRVCVDNIANASRCVPPSGLQACSSDSDCVTGERCVTNDGNSGCLSAALGGPNTSPPSTNPPGTNPPGTNSPGTIPPGTNPPDTNPSGTNPGPVIPDLPSPGGTATQDGSGEGNPSEPCIGVDSLVHFSRQQLVFERDILANVLCDENKSCATPGHMVSYHGKGMMMKSYCEMVEGCERKVMYVNSPRYVRGVTVPSKSENMVFTAFSARYATRAEEGMLSFAIRLGL